MHKRVLIAAALLVAGCSSSAQTPVASTSGGGGWFFSKSASPSPTATPSAKPTYSSPLGKNGGLSLANDPKAPGVRTYTVQPGDTVSAIAGKTGVTWDAIYNANAAIIEAGAHSNGFASSENGHWIFSGETFFLP